MCKISESITLCTCKAKSTESLKNYWSLHRFSNENESFIVGEVFMNYNFSIEDYNEMQQQLLLKLNKGDIFDVIINFESNDKLVIAICETIFEFIYVEELWQCVDYDYFELVNNYKEISFGKIKN
ncbi:MAG: hypothetical protein RLZZ175_3059 [Bacteroidota bacterium]|jgi:hypothetical protein